MSGASGRFIASDLIFATSGFQSSFPVGLEVHQHSRAVEPKYELRINAVLDAPQWLE